MSAATPIIAATNARPNANERQWLLSQPSSDTLSPDTRVPMSREFAGVTMHHAPSARTLSVSDTHLMWGACTVALKLVYSATPHLDSHCGLTVRHLSPPHATRKPVSTDATFILANSGDRDALHALIADTFFAPTKPVLFVVNPFGGLKLATKIYDTVVEPMMRLSGIPFTSIESLHKGHAEEMLMNTDVHKYSAIVAVSGDGVFHEVCNALMSRRDWRSARKIPIGTIGAGSSNAMNQNLGHKFVEYGVLSIIKGTTKPMDLISVSLHESKKVVYSHLNMAFAYLADLDIESDRFRWMGREKVTFSALLRLLNLRKYRANVGIAAIDGPAPLPVPQSDLDDTAKLDPVQTDLSDMRQCYGPKRHYETIPLNNLQTFPIQLTAANDPLSFFSASNLPWIASDFQASHIASMDCGFMDVTYGGKEMRRLSILSSFISGSLPADGSRFGVERVKARGFRIEPFGWSWSLENWNGGAAGEEREKSRLFKTPGGHVAVSGEPFGMETVTVELHEKTVNVFTAM
ncbi:ATP-NAD kinase-like domain-containing protein [Chytriomyces cf. hyalinus JEL632]|nr:ATP-NAD kinase-like domain-containing protein [Chytriomyces cf. hyalinus JEL632]